MELIYVICQIASASICEEHRAMVFSQAPMACVFAAPAELAQLTRPGWQVARWRCEADRAAERPIKAALE